MEEEEEAKAQPVGDYNVKGRDREMKPCVGGLEENFLSSNWVKMEEEWLLLAHKGIPVGLLYEQHGDDPSSFFPSPQTTTHVMSVP